MQEKPSHDYLKFSKRERRAILVWVFLVVILKLTGYVYENYLVRKHGSLGELVKFTGVIDSFRAEPYNDKGYTPRKRQYEDLNNTYETAGHISLFEFDPNTATAEEWSKLGVSDKTIAGIKKYLSKGGRFRKPEDIQKIWGIKNDHALKLLAYVKIPPEPERPKTYLDKKNFSAHKILAIDINLSDSLAWESLPGIGSKLAGRIIKFRDKLGGFHSLSQVSETFGLTDSVFQKIKPLLKISESPLKKININEAGLDELKTHPYIRYQLAKVIIEYRKQHQRFQEPADLKKIMIITEEQFIKIKPYIITGN